MTQTSLDRLDNARHWTYVTDTKVPVCFETGLESIDGQWFTLLREPHHTDADMKAAKVFLKWTQDVVSIKEERLK